jgi:hypothetical protein
VAFATKYGGGGGLQQKDLWVSAINPKKIGNIIENIPRCPVFCPQCRLVR